MAVMNDVPVQKPHDLGGLPAGPVDRSEHDIAWWEQRIDAMLGLCFAKGLIKDAAELRNNIESLGPEAYETMSYYERWAASLASLLQGAGVVTQDEIDAKIAELRNKSESGE